MIWSHFFATLGWAALTVLIFMIIAFAIAVRVKRTSVADVAWGLGFIIVAVVGLTYNDLYSARQLLVGMLVLVWGLRLAAHIYNRNKGKEDDFRYREMAEKNGGGKAKMFTSVFLTQGALLLAVSLPVTFVMAAFIQSPLNWLDYLGAAVWMVGFSFETLGDMQLARFVNDKRNKGKIMDRGVWRYSRHPNYFGEVTQWWGIGLIALNVPQGVFGLVGPALISYLIIFVSGVPTLERHYDGNKSYAQYRERTSILVPLPPKKV